MKKEFIKFLKIAWYLFSVEKRQLDYYLNEIRHGHNISDSEAEKLKELIANEIRIYER